MGTWIRIPLPRKSPWLSDMGLNIKDADGTWELNLPCAIVDSTSVATISCAQIFLHDGALTWWRDTCSSWTSTGTSTEYYLHIFYWQLNTITKFLTGSTSRTPRQSEGQQYSTAKKFPNLTARYGVRTCNSQLSWSRELWTYLTEPKNLCPPTPL